MDPKRAEIVQVAYTWNGRKYKFGGDGNGDNAIDCSHFVYQVIRKVFPDANFMYLTTDGITTSTNFSVVTEPQPGDLVWWPGHVAIVTDSVVGKFIGAQTSTGVKEESYRVGYWSTHLADKRKFYRYNGFQN